MSIPRADFFSSLLGSSWLRADQSSSNRSSIPDSSVQPQRLERSLAKVTIEDGINVLEDVGVYFEELAFVLDGDEGPLGAVVHGDLQRLGERPDGLHVALDAHVAEDQKRGRVGGRAILSQGRLAGALLPGKVQSRLGLGGPFRARGVPHHPSGQPCAPPAKSSQNVPARGS